MADSAIVAYSGDWVFFNGDVAEGALLEVFDAGTTNHAAIFSDSDLTVAAPNPLVADANGLLPFAWIGTQTYKVRLTTAGGTMIDEQDTIEGALDLAPFQVGQFAKPDTPVTARTSAYSMQASDIGGVINADPTGGAFAITLMSAVTVGNGRGVTIKHVGTANGVTVETTASQTISFLAGAREEIALPAYGAVVKLVSDGSNWHVDGEARALGAPFGPGMIIVNGRVDSDPGTSAVGALFIVESAFDGFAAGDIIEYAGSEWNVYTPAFDCGWLAYVQDESCWYAFTDADAWIPVGILIPVLDTDTNPDGDDDFVVTWDDSAEVHKKVPLGMLPGSIIAIIEDRKSQNTQGQNLSGANNVRQLNTLAYNRGSLVSLNSNAFELPAGTWEIAWHAPTANNNVAWDTQSYLWNETDSAVVARGTLGHFDEGDGGDGGQADSWGRTVVTITDPKEFQIRQAVSSAVSGGLAGNFGVEVYTRVEIRRA